MKIKAQWLAAGLLAILLLAIAIKLAPPEPEFAVGPSLPPGKVTPQFFFAHGTAVLLAPDGSLWTWGDAVSLSETTDTSQVPERISSDLGLCPKIAANQCYILAVKSDGSLWGMGWNFGQLAQPTNHVAIPTRFGIDTDWCQIGAAPSHCLALKTNGSLWSWGRNESGQVGNGTTNNVLSMLPVGLEKDWKSITAVDCSSYALKKDGTLWGWGSGGFGTNTLTPTQLDSNTNWASIFANYSILLALKTDGTLWLRGKNASIAVSGSRAQATTALAQIGRDTNWTQVYPGRNCFFARKGDGSWWCCGENSDGQLGMGLPPAVPSPILLPFKFEPWAFATEEGTTLLLTKDGALWTWGRRLGADRTVARVKTTLNRLFSQLPGHHRPFTLVDKAPHKIWQLPDGMTVKPVNTTNISVESHRDSIN